MDPHTKWLQLAEGKVPAGARYLAKWRIIMSKNKTDTEWPTNFFSIAPTIVR